jgi:hypothetical protein
LGGSIDLTGMKITPEDCGYLEVAFDYHHLFIWKAVGKLQSEPDPDKKRQMKDEKHL